jgi:hypothetical protein
MADGLAPPCGKAADFLRITTAVVERYCLTYYLSRCEGGGVTWRVPCASARSLSHCLAYTYAHAAVDRESVALWAWGDLASFGGIPCSPALPATAIP